MAFDFKSFPRVLADIVAYQSSYGLIDDKNPGSTILTIDESFASEIYQQYIQMITLIQAFNLDSISGTDLDNKALEYGIIRQAATKARDYLTISDSSITKIETLIYPGTNGAVASQTTLDIVNADDFPSSGTVIVGTGESSEEVVSYSSITTNPNYYTLNLTGGLSNNHRTTEKVTLSQGGLRTITAGIVAYVPQTNISSAVYYTVVEEIYIQDGDDSIDNVLVECTVAGTIGNASSDTITEFQTIPFPNAVVTNPTAFSNGTDEETDQELRDRIRNHIQSLSMGTITAIKTLISGLTNDDQTKRVVSSNYVEAIDDSASFLYIDDGSGLEPSFDNVDVEYVMRRAAGTELYLQLDNFPVLKAPLITQNETPYNIVNNSQLIVEIGNIQETITFDSSDFTNINNASALEIATAINNKASTIEARTIENKTKVIVQPVAQSDESIKIITPISGIDNANDILGFSIDETYTLKLYKNDILLNKDGRTAFVDSANSMPFALNNGDTLKLYIDNKTTNLITITFDTGDFVDINNATALEVVDAINAELPGGYATTLDNDTRVRIYSRNELNADSYIRIQGSGGGGDANVVLGFPTTLIQGLDNDYILNRYNGKIKLTVPLIADDIITAGTIYTEAFLQTASPEPYSLTAGKSLNFNIDGGALQTFTITSTTAYTAQQVADLINEDSTLIGIYAYVVVQGAENYLRIATNRLSLGGSIFLDSSSDLELDFTTNVLKSNQAPNIAYLVPTNIQNYLLGPNQNLTLIIDNDVNNKLFNITMSINGIVSSFTNAHEFYSTDIRNNYSNEDDFFNNFILRFSDSTATAALRGYQRNVTSYVGSTGRFVISDDLPAIPAINDNFDLIPTTSLNIKNFLNNTKITPLTLYAYVKLIEGTVFQLSTLTSGSDGALQVTGGTANSVLIPFSSEGDAGGVGTFEVDSRGGLYSGILDTVGPNDYCGGMKVILDNSLNSFTYDFTSSGTAGGVVEVAEVRKININDGVVIKSSTQTTYLNGYVYDINGSTSHTFLSSGDAYGQFTIAATTGLNIGDLVVIRDSNTASYTNGYIYNISPTPPAPGPYTITIYDYDTDLPANLTAYTTGASAKLYYTPFDITIYDNTTGVAKNLSAFTTTDTAQISSIYDKGFIRSISGATAPYTITIWDEDSNIIVDTLSMYSLAGGAVLTDRNSLNFNSTRVDGIDGYKYFNDLLQKIQWKVDGLEDDPIEYPGVKAAGVKIEVAAPIIMPVNITLEITTLGNISVSSISSQIKSAVIKYINNLKVGEDVILSSIIAAVRAINTVYDCKVEYPLDDIVIADNEIPRIEASNILLNG